MTSALLASTVPAGRRSRLFAFHQAFSGGSSAFADEWNTVLIRSPGMVTCALALVLLYPTGATWGQDSSGAPLGPALIGASAQREAPFLVEEESSGEAFQNAECYDEVTWTYGSGSCAGDCWRRFCDFTNRRSQTHGRAIGPGRPLRGTSWLNRPFEFTTDFGALIMTGSPGQNVRARNDLFAAIRLGWDWDHYWGGETRLGWSTPEITTEGQTGPSASDNLFLADYSVMYYPWGDSLVRPYGRFGMGLTDIEYTNVNGARQSEMLYTLPFGVGLKYQHRRWLAWRVELLDNLALGQNETNTMHNLTFSAGLEYRFGGRPSNYWAWHPRGYGQ